MVAGEGEVRVGGGQLSLSFLWSGNSGLTPSKIMFWAFEGSNHESYHRMGSREPEKQWHEDKKESGNCMRKKRSPSQCIISMEA